MLRLVSLLSKFKRFWVAGWVAGRVAGKAENIDQLSPAKLEFGLGLSLAIIVILAMEISERNAEILR